MKNSFRLCSSLLHELHSTARSRTAIGRWQPTTLVGAWTFAVAFALSSCGHVGIDLEGEQQDDGTPSDDDASEGTDEGVDKTDGEPPARETDETETGSETGTDEVELTETESSDEHDAGSESPEAGVKPVETDPGETDPIETDPSNTDSDAGPLRDAGPSRDASVPSDASLIEPGPERDAGSEDPRDAAAETDAGLPVRIDASINSVSCLPDCSCNASEGCDFSCDGVECWPACAAGSECTIDVGEATSVGIECGEGAVCEAYGSTGFVTEYSCEGQGECLAHCGSAESCSLSCVDSVKCVLDCADAADCSINCGENARCHLIHSNVNTETELACSEAARKECSNSLLTCNTTCP